MIMNGFGDMIFRMNGVCRTAVFLTAVVITVVCVGYLFAGVAHGIQVSESVEINGTGTLLTMSTLPQASDYASGVGVQSYMRELEVDDEGGTALSTYYELDGATQRRNRYAITAIHPVVGVRHSVDVCGLKNIKTENFIESDSVAFYTDIGMRGSGNLSASIRVADGRHPTDYTMTFADGGFDYIASVYGMAPPAGGDNDDWLACGLIGEGTWPVWLEDDVDAAVFDVDETGEGCYVE